MKKHLIQTVLFMALVVVSSQTFCQQTIKKRIDSVMDIAFRRGIFNGNVLVAKAGKVIYQAGFGFAEAGKKGKLKPETLFDIGSVSKEFNGVSIMLLKEKKLLDLDDPIAKFLPDLGDWAKRVKVRHLISYTSGIPIFDPLAMEPDSVVWRNLTGLKSLQFEPGSSYLYNHYNVYLQMRIIEKASGLSYADFIRDHIFIPLGMKDAVVDYPPDGERIAKAFDGQFRPTPYGQGMSGWVRLSAGDLYRFADALDHFRLISGRVLQGTGLELSRRRKQPGLNWI
ncbi:serine hydrolase domain-containing protein [Pedobacter sp. UC225_61]|uniref:serine hydrolase domain-containing protein n=1 Tax=Pedobacter sp. UC225_61 TaxID=3374623 RepID=UPI00379C4E7A